MLGNCVNLKLHLGKVMQVLVSVIDADCQCNGSSKRSSCCSDKAAKLLDKCCGSV